MDDWNIFYWDWWIAWSPFVGMFIANISRGRTIRQFINATLTAPVGFSILWLSIFGGVGVRMERNAELANITCSSVLCGGEAKESLDGLYRLSCREKTDMWFDVMESDEGLGTVLSLLSLVSIVLYFVTSSDSGSLAIACLSANGDPEPPVLQRIFWALTESATTTALLYAGGKDALIALQTVSIASGVPYTIILCFMCVALWRAVKIEAGDLNIHGPQFTTALLDVLSTPTTESVSKVFLSVLAPWYFTGVAAGEVDRRSRRRCIHMLILVVPFYGAIALFAMGYFQPNLPYVGLSVLFGFFAYATKVRNSIREKHDINGNKVEDFFAVSCLYPFAAYQMETHMQKYEPRSAAVEELPVVSGKAASECCRIQSGEMGKLLNDPDAKNTDV